MSSESHHSNEARGRRVVFQPVHRRLLLGELRTLTGVLTDAIQTATARGAEGDDEYAAAKNEELAVVQHAIGRITLTQEGQPFELALPAPMMAVVVRGATEYAAELLQRQVEELKPEVSAEAAADLRAGIDVVSAWAEALVALGDTGPAR